MFTAKLEADRLKGCPLPSIESTRKLCPKCQEQFRKALEAYGI